MLKFISKRVVESFITLLIVITIVFLLLRQMPVSGYFENYERLSSKQIEIGLDNMGLNDPIPKQLFDFFKNISKGDFGKSTRYSPNGSVTALIKPKMPVSFAFGTIALFISLLLGLPMGILMVRNRGGFFDKFITMIIVLIQAVPAAIYHIIIQFYGSKALAVSMTYRSGDIKTYILPIFSLCLANLAYYSMWIRRFMIDESNKDYVKLASAKGVSNRRIISKHMFRNAIVPLVQYIPTSLMLTIIGSIYVESLYGVPGMGGLLIDVIKAQDNSMVQTLVILYSTISILGLLFGDIFMSIADPRISLSNKKAGA